MEIGKLLYVKDRKDWRRWLLKNHDKEKEIWLLYHKKSSGKPRISYDDSVEEALCFGWIDSTVKKIDDESFAQRYTPRRPKSPVSETNKERVRRMIAEGKMTEVGFAALSNFEEEFEFPADILAVLKSNRVVWKNFESFPKYYQKIRVAFVEGARNRPEEFKRRLNNLLKMTKKGKKFGMVQ